MNTISNQKALKRFAAGKGYDHNPDHFQFRRTIDGYYPERKAPRDWISFVVLVVIWAAFAAAYLSGVNL